jgi:hypothetical protein
MKKHNPLLMIGLISLSVLSSFLFILYGMNIVMSEEVAGGIVVFAYVSIAYGLANVSILSIAWSSREAWAVGASKFISLCFLGVFVMDTINAGLKSGLGAVGILVLALALCVNWFAIKMVIERN